MNINNSRFGKWWNSVPRLEKGAWYFGFLAMIPIAQFSPLLALVIYGFLIGWLIRAVQVSKFTKAIVTTLIIGSLALSVVPQRSKAQDSKPPVVDCNVFVIGGLIIVVGGFIVYKVNQFCKKHFPPPPPKQPPPTPPPTNKPPNSPKFFSHPFNLNVSEPEVTSVDISTNGWIDYTVPTNPVPFQDFISLKCSNSVDMVAWSNCYSIGIWMSSNSVETVIYDGSGTPQLTNWLAGNPYVNPMTTFIPFKIYDASKPKQFFKMSQ